ncbi:uncharacterized protein TNCV_4132081 [Trichonephila clavipes]|nr:uncharacterized protein TNCV_4132081 [Trichonephila clavipes]
MDDPIYYDLRVISIATGTSVKCNSSKSFLSFKAYLDLSCSRIMHAHMVQRLFETFVQPNTCNFFPLSAYSPHISPIEPVWDLVGRCLARDPCPAA